jgi:large subunit ribosomal protein L3
MGGQMGNGRVTVRNLEIVDVNTEENVIAIKGAIPGPKGSFVVVRRSRR